ncbi:MAG: CHASE domain-containing protein [Candidatus Omnitrophica bacterium]|nr:CHASE domain-containing protein [Candidatus Omnitrophota bacterium]
MIATPTTSSPAASYRQVFLPFGIGAAFAILAVLLAGTLTGWWYVDQTLRHRAHNAFANQVRYTLTAIDKRLSAYLDILAGFRGLYAASKRVERDEFAAYASSLQLQQRYPGMVAVGFIERVPAAEVPAFLERVRGDTSLRPEGYPAFTIHPEGDRAEYLVVSFREPLGPDERVLGFDLATEPTRRSAAEHARDTGELTATSRLTLHVDVDAAEPAFILLLPVYRNGLPQRTLEERRTALHGYVAGGFRWRELFVDLLGAGGLPSQMTFEAFDGDLLSDESRIYHAGPAAAANKDDLIHTMTVGGRLWSLRFHGAPEAFLRRTERLLPLMVLWVGVIFSLLVFAVSYGLATSRANAVALARRMTEDFRKSELHFRSLIEHAMDVITVIEPTGIIRYDSPAVGRVLGYRPEEQVGQVAFAYIHPEDLPGVMALLTETIKIPGASRSATFRYKHKDGSWRVLESVSTNLITDPIIRGIVLNSRDVTERQRAANELKKTYDQLKETQAQLLHSEKLASIGQLAAGVAHEVKNPLAIIIQGVSFLEIGPLAQQPQEQEILQMMKKAVQRADRIIRTLLEFARPSQGAPKRLALPEIVDSSVELARTQAAKNIQVTYTADPNMPAIVADENQLRQVFVNLIINACQAMPNGGTATIHTYAKPVTARELSASRNAPKRWAAGSTGVFCDVEDTGVGIPEHLMKKIGEPFFTTKPTGQGTGLGVSVSLGIIERHRGLFILESREGQGTKISVVFPAAAETA